MVEVFVLCNWPKLGDTIFGHRRERKGPRMEKLTCMSCACRHGTCCGSLLHDEVILLSAWNIIAQFVWRTDRLHIGNSSCQILRTGYQSERDKRRRLLGSISSQAGISELDQSCLQIFERARSVDDDDARALCRLLNLKYLITLSDS